MKKIVFILFCILSTFSVQAQNTERASDDLGRIALNPMILSNSRIPQSAHKMLDSKLTQIVTMSGLAADSPVSRFVITADAQLIGKEVTATTPVMTVVEIAALIYVGDSRTGQLYGTYAYPSIKGVGTNETKAYHDAFKKLNVNDPGVKKFVESSKERIVEYYNSQIDFLIAEAQALHDSQKYEEAIALLSTVPNVCKDAYIKAMAMISTVYQSKIDRDGLELYNEAFLLWKVSKNYDSALSAVELIAQINPFSSAASKGRGLVKEIESHYAEIEARRRELEERRWAFEQQKYADAQTAMAEQQQINYEIAMAKAMNSQEATELALREVKNIVELYNASETEAARNVASWFR